MKARWFDPAAAVALAVAVAAGSLLVERFGDVQRPFDAFAATLLTVSCLVTAVRRSRPTLTMLVAAACCVGYYGLLYPGIFAAAPVLLAVYTAVARGHRYRALAVAIGLLLAIYLAVTVAVGSGGFDGMVWLAGWLAAIIAIGELVAKHRRYLAEVEHRLAEADRARTEAEARKAAEERLWIAQELHDTLTHSISVINVQAGVAAHLHDGDSAATGQALSAIRQSSQEAMRELRATLGVLRQSDHHTMTPGLDRLPALAERAGGIGVPVKVTILGERRDLPAEVDAAAYRVLQEAVTNVLRHAGQVPVCVTVEYHCEALELLVVNDGDSPREPVKQGMGLTGMRERVVAFGGSLTAGPHPDGGFAVRAVLPLAKP